MIKCYSLPNTREPLPHFHNPGVGIPVLPFQALDSAAQEGRIGEGISEQVTVKLMNLKGLRLISPRPVVRNKSLRHAALRLATWTGPLK
jgi:TolB-like protein